MNRRPVQGSMLNTVRILMKQDSTLSADDIFTRLRPLFADYNPRYLRWMAGSYRNKILRAKSLIAIGCIALMAGCSTLRSRYDISPTAESFMLYVSDCIVLAAARDKQALTDVALVYERLSAHSGKPLTAAGVRDVMFGLKIDESLILITAPMGTYASLTDRYPRTRATMFVALLDGMSRGIALASK